MNFPRQTHWKRKLDASLSTPASQLIPTNHLPKSEIVSKGKIIIESYEYDEENLIGEGAFSKVYLGRKIKDHRFLIAVKVIDKRKISKDKQNFELLKQEMEIHKELDHPNIAKCHEIIEKNNNFYFILEYCPHGTLDNFIKKFNNLSESVTTNILEQIMSGYKYLMTKKIIHRDLKPPNILKSGFVWKICDFGFSVKGKKNLIGELNVGTPSYMAPESLQRNYYSPKTDFFSFGVICYEMLFGNPPWNHKNQKILLQMILQNKLNPQKIQSLTNKNLSSFILKCCDPVERKRITPQQFQSFDFWKIIPGTKQEPSILNQQKPSLRPSSRTFYVKNELDSTNGFSHSSNLSSTKNFKKEPLEETLIKNEKIIQKQINCIKIIYELLKNIREVQFTENDDKQIYLTILQRHSLHIVRRIKQVKFNYLGLKRLEQYMLTPAFTEQSTQVNQLSYKLQNILNGETRRKSIVAIRIINRKYDELTYDKMLSNRCINNIKEYFTELTNRLLPTDVSSISNKKKGTIHFLLDYYRYVNSHGINSEAQQGSTQKVLENYSDKVYGQEQFSKIVQEIRRLKL